MNPFKLVKTDPGFFREVRLAMANQAEFEVCFNDVPTGRKYTIDYPYKSIIEDALNYGYQKGRQNDPD